MFIHQDALESEKARYKVGENICIIHKRQILYPGYIKHSKNQY